MGTPKGLQLVRKIVEECMRNIHPIYNIKAEMIKREIARNPELKDEDWKRFVPTFKKKNVQRKVKKQQKVGNSWHRMSDLSQKKSKSIFPPPQQLRKVDMEMMSGEYFLSPQEKEAAKRREKEQKQAEKAQERKIERNKSFVAPKEPKTKESKTNDNDLQDSIAKIKVSSGSLNSLTFQNASGGSKKRKASSDNLADYVDSHKSKKRRHEKK